MKGRGKEKSKWTNGELSKSIKISKTKEPQHGQVAWFFSPVAGHVFITESLL